MSKLDNLYFQVAKITNDQPLPDSKKHVWAKVDDSYIVWLDKRQIKDLMLELIEANLSSPLSPGDKEALIQEVKDL